MKLLGNYCRNIDVKTSITVGVVGKFGWALNVLLEYIIVSCVLHIGLPNVGKSSVINSLKRKKTCGVGACPGITKWVASTCNAAILV